VLLVQNRLRRGGGTHGGGGGGGGGAGAVAGVGGWGAHLGCLNLFLLGGWVDTTCSHLGVQNMQTTDRSSLRLFLNTPVSV
jgi:hypothetical protein